MKLSHLASPDFQNVVKKLMQASLAPSVAFKLKKLVMSLESELKIFEDTRNSLIQEYSEKNEDGSPKVNENGMVNLDMTKVQEWQPKFNDLMTIESSVELPKISLADLGDKVELSVSDLFILDGIVVE